MSGNVFARFANGWSGGYNIEMAKDYDSTVARMAGNIMGSLVKEYNSHQNDHIDLMRRQDDVVMVVQLARAIIEEAKRTEPPVVQK